jgi:predicted RNA-binding Zn ribbon-like protein
MDRDAQIDLALDFVNTGRGRDPDPWISPLDMARWLDERVPTGRVPTLPAARRLLDEAVRLRHAIGALLGAVSAERPLPPRAVEALERTLASGAWRKRLVPGHGELALLEVLEVLEPSPEPLARLAPLALAAARLIETAAPDRVRTCAAEDCGRWFLDVSRGGRRRWCSMDTCGNRAKAARWRARHGKD